jgi:hypothetical protein
MKFRTHTKMMTAFFKDIELAGEQGTISSIYYNGFTFGQAKSIFVTSYTNVDPKLTPLIWAFLFVSSVSFAWAGASLMGSRAEVHARRLELLKEPLVYAGGVSA